MKVLCRFCNYKIDASIYKNNELGLRESLLNHIKYHEENDKIDEYYDNGKKILGEQT